MNTRAAFSTRIGVLGDVHGEDQTVEAALVLFAREGVEAVLCVGDILDGPGDALRTITLLRDGGVEVVRGNHERWWQSDTMRDLPDAIPRNALAQDLADWVCELPLCLEYQTPLGRMLLCHGLGGDDMATLRPDEFGYALQTNDALQSLLRKRAFGLVLSGHSHRRMVRTLEGMIFVNAGTLLREHEPCVALLDFRAGEVRFFDARQGRLEGGQALKLGSPPRDAP